LKQLPLHPLLRAVIDQNHPEAGGRRRGFEANPTKKLPRQIGIYETAPFYKFL
jgi:hypothetical protein